MEEMSLPDILDLLVDGPSHVAGLYASFVKHVQPLSAGDFTQAIKELDRRGLVSLWFQDAGEARRARPSERDDALERYVLELPDHDLESLYHDEIGMWCEITRHGRRLWREAGYEVELDGALWTVDEQCSDGALTIHAESEYAAQRVLDWWLDRREDQTSVRDISIRPVSNFQLQDGRTVEGGVVLSCRLAEDRKDSRS